jgi:TIR domain
VLVQASWSMTDWRVILQFESATHAMSSCERYVMAGVVLPARISVVACDPKAEPSAGAVHAEIDDWLRRLGARGATCDGPRGMGCMSWGEPSCQHVLVLVIGSAALDPAYERMASEWLKESRGRGVVITAMVPPLEHVDVFGGGGYPRLSKSTGASWGGVATQLAASVLAAALLDEKPGVFISYLRKEASASAEDIYDALTHAGFRVFLDRFNGTPGRVFPHELAEEMASMGLVALLETSGLRRSRWTMWEVAFARRYRLGPVAIKFGGAPGVHATAQRHVVPNDPAVSLPTHVVGDVVRFIRYHYLAVAVSRRAYFETLVRSAAQAGGGDATDIGRGMLSLDKPAGNTMGCVLPAGVPGRLRHVTRFMQSGNAGPYVLAGEHQHLAPADREDLRWLASYTHVKLAGSASVYRTVRGIV